MDGLNGVEVLGSRVLYKGLLKFLKVAEVVGVIVESTSPHWEEGSKDCNGRGYRVERIFGHFRTELRISSSQAGGRRVLVTSAPDENGGGEVSIRNQVRRAQYI